MKNLPKAVQWVIFYLSFFIYYFFAGYGLYVGISLNYEIVNKPFLNVMIIAILLSPFLIIRFWLRWLYPGKNKPNFSLWFAVAIGAIIIWELLGVYKSEPKQPDYLYFLFPVLIIWSLYTSNRDYNKDFDRFI